MPKDYQKYKEVYKKANRKHYELNREKLIEKGKKNYQKNKKRQLELRKERYQKNKKEIIQQNSLYTKTPNGIAVRRAITVNSRRKKIGRIDDIERVKTKDLFDLLKRHKKCMFCSSNDFLEIDHIVPLSKGGKNVIENLQILCRKCNRVKGNNIV